VVEQSAEGDYQDNDEGVLEGHIEGQLQDWDGLIVEEEEASDNGGGDQGDFSCSD